MWQRIQTLYLAVSTVLLFILFFSDAYTVTAPDGMQYVTYLQIRKPFFAILLGLQIWLVVDCIKTHNTPVFSLTAVFPVVAMILNLLAARGILADELLVRNSSRLRAAKRGKK